MPLLLAFTQSDRVFFAATINDTLGPETTLDRQDVSDFVDEMKIDLDLWFE